MPCRVRTESDGICLVLSPKHFNDCMSMIWLALMGKPNLLIRLNELLVARTDVVGKLR